VKIRFQADWDLNGDIVSGVLRREPAVDFQSAAAAGLAGVGDPDVLSRAATAGHSRPAQHASSLGALAATQSSAGVLIVPQNLPVRDAIEDLILIWACCEAEEWVDVLDFLPL
jgi:hypothetical protein